MQNAAARVDASRQSRKVSSRLESVPPIMVVFCVLCILANDGCPW